MWSIFYGDDAGLTHFIHSFSKLNFIGDGFVLFITNSGIPLMVLAVAGQWWSRRNRSQLRFVMLATGFSFLLALTLNQIIKLSVQRTRPYDVGVTNLLVSPSLDSSFPSEHTSAAFATAFSFLFRSRTRQGLIFLISPSVVALSRVYVGTHFISDLLGGILTAFTAAIIVSVVYREDISINKRLVGFF